MIVFDITFKEVCPVRIPTLFFCDLDTSSIHLNASIFELQKILLSKGVTQKEIDEIEQSEFKINEQYAEHTISHEVIHILLDKMIDRWASVKWDDLDQKHDIIGFSELGENCEE